MLHLQPLFFIFTGLLFLLVAMSVSATDFVLHNSCNFTVWPGTISGNNAGNLGGGGFTLPPGGTIRLTANPGWSGRFWARTGCNFDFAGNGKCVTGDCGGRLKCVGGGVPPVSLLEFTIGNGGMDFYDVSLVDGYNVGVGVLPIGGKGDCQYAGCVADVNSNCPPELRVVDGGGSESVVACRSACDAFRSSEFCCTEEHSTPETCTPTKYSTIFKKACPAAYSYAYDDLSSTCTCTGSHYSITFCPSS